LDPWQMPRQCSAVGPAPADRPAPFGRRYVLFLGLGCRNALLEIFERKRQLIGIKALRATPETVPLQRDDDGSQPIALAADPGALRFVLRALGDEQRTQRCRIGREIVDVERHVFDVSQPRWDAKPSDELDAEVSQRVAGYCVACGTRTSISR